MPGQADHQIREFHPIQHVPRNLLTITLGGRGRKLVSMWGPVTRMIWWLFILSTAWAINLNSLAPKWLPPTVASTTLWEGSRLLLFRSFTRLGMDPGSFFKRGPVQVILFFILTGISWDPGISGTMMAWASLAESWMNRSRPVSRYSIFRSWG